jgi:hypothetical protein
MAWRSLAEREKRRAVLTERHRERRAELKTRSYAHGFIYFENEFH